MLTMKKNELDSHSDLHEFLGDCLSGLCYIGIIIIIAL